MAIEGALQDVSLADICQLLGMGRKTGCLSMTDRSNFGYIYFEKGRIIYASVLNRRDRLGELLVRNHVITRKDLSDAVEAQSQAKGKRLGEVLVGKGTISEEELKKYIQLQIEEAVYHLFTWQQGSFHFDPDQMPDEEGIYLVSIPAEALLMEGARRVDEWSQIEKKIPRLPRGAGPRRGGHGRVHARPAKGARPARRRTFVPRGPGGVRPGRVRRGQGALWSSKPGSWTRPAARWSRTSAGRRRGPRPAPHPRGGLPALRNAEDAVREFQSALALEGANAEALFRLGLIAFGRPVHRSPRVLRRMKPEGASARALARTRGDEMLGRYEEALAVLDGAERLGPGDPEIALARAIVLLKMGSVREALDALRAYRASSEVRKPSPVYYAYAVLAAGMAGDVDSAVALGREGLVSYPESGPILVNLGAVLELKGRWTRPRRSSPARSAHRRSCRRRTRASAIRPMHAATWKRRGSTTRRP
jgi:tetratricopeptide (TPR) repeat protein